MTHDELVERAVRWLKKPASHGKLGYKGGCGVVVPELVSNCPEQPDAIGFSGYVSWVVECKTTISDFYADMRKPGRKHGGRGVGGYRFYMCPPKLIRPGQLPEGWGLLYAHPRVTKIIAWPTYNQHRNMEGEHAMLYSVLRRAELRFDLSQCFSPKWGGAGVALS